MQQITVIRLQRAKYRRGTRSTCHTHLFTNNTFGSTGGQR